MSALYSHSVYTHVLPPEDTEPPKRPVPRGGSRAPSPQQYRSGRQSSPAPPSSSVLADVLVSGRLSPAQALKIHCD